MHDTSKKRMFNSFGIKYFLFFIALLILISINSCREEEREVFKQKRERVKPGVEVFLEKHLASVKGKRLGLITNPTGVDSNLRSVAELFSEHEEIKLVALYGPEHGVRGNAQAGEYVPFYFDEKFGIPVFSLYRQSIKPQPGMLKNIDEYMRTFDTTDAGKIPDKKMIQDLEVMVFDVQDVGTRIYTYVSTMAFAMEACAEAGIEFIVLDRPNPINGVSMEGPVLNLGEKSEEGSADEASSFVSLFPVPVRHGMTAGELAKLYNDVFLKNKALLTVIPVEGWKRKMWYDETGLPWVIPSPNMPTLETATVYPGQVFLEGTNLSEGRGTTKPFELFGAPWIDGHELTKRLNSLALEGVIFREAWFTPVFSKYQGELCRGAQLHVFDRNSFKPFETTLHILKTVIEMYPDKFSFYPDYFDKIMGSSSIRLSLLEGAEIREIFAGIKKELEDFSKMRKKYLIY